jgi:hypothetical protein
MNYVFIGFDHREADAYAVCKHSIERSQQHDHPPHFQVMPLILPRLQEMGYYNRPTERRDGRLFDVISEHPMSTEFAISRFLVPHLARIRNRAGAKHLPYGTDDFAIFMDSDMLVTRSLDEVFALADRSKAVQVVQHKMTGKDGVKMDGQAQSYYDRKNWSSFILWNINHPALDCLTPDFVNSATGRFLHGFTWLTDEEIGELPFEWNFLVGHDRWFDDTPPANIHFTEGVPSMSGYENCEYADFWRDHLYSWAAS